MKTEIYVARHERHEAIEAYNDLLTQEQKDFLSENEGDFMIMRDTTANTVKVLMIEDEG